MGIGPQGQQAFTRPRVEWWGMPINSHSGLTAGAVAAALPTPARAANPQYRAGSVADFDRLYQDSYPRLKRTLTAVLGDPTAAEDCVQETFLRA
ncbi:MAG: hypothetical protein M3Z13_06665, partial [Candidatus Dormibacteraeota bacterium]|nr:hypothetical protein [Candidatus Dormibacteraeota bacterium]